MKININLKNIIKYLILFVLACILIYYSNTLEVKAYTVSTDSIYICDSSDNAISNDYYYVIDGENYIGDFGTTYQGVMSAFSTRFNAQIQQGNTYTLELNANTGDWRNININSIQEFGSIGSHCSDNLNAYTVTSVVSTYYKITITFIANSTSNYSKLVIYNSNGNAITGISNFKIDSMALTDLGNTNTSDIINNQQQNTQDIIENDKQNTQDIIDNNDNNTQDIIDNQDKNNEELKDTITDIFTEDCHPSNNLLPFLDGTWSTRGITMVAKNGVYDISGTFNGTAGGITIDIPDFTLQPGTYTINLNRKGTAIYPYFTLQGDQSIGIRDGKSITFTLDSAKTFTSIYFYFGTTSYNSQYSIMLSIGSTPQSFEQYGIQVCNNKLDDLKDNQQATNDKLDEQIQQDKEQHEEQMESQQVCTKKIIDKNNIIEDGFLDEDGTKINSTTDGITNYIEINNVTKIKVLQVWEWSNSCFYDNNKTKISCFKNNQTVGSYIEVPQNAKYIRISIQKNTNKPQYEIETCKNGNQALNDSLNNSDISGANQDANNFFNNFENNDFGLSDIITLPLTTIQSITSKSCTPLSLTLPFVNKTFELPCMNTIYSKFEPFYFIYQTITFGVISYWVCVQIYAMVKGFKDPTSDEIEVMDL